MQSKGTLDIKQAVRLLKKGEVIIFPTDTVWGVGASVKSKEGIARLYSLKRREADKPTAVLIGTPAQGEALGIFSPQSRMLASRYWPGAATIIVRATASVPHSVRGNGETVGLRMPKFSLVQQLCEKLGTGIVAASANFAGKTAPRRQEELDPEFVTKVGGVMAGEAGGAEPSTVVDTTVTPMRVVRQGAIEVTEATVQ